MQYLQCLIMPGFHLFFVALIIPGFLFIHAVFDDVDDAGVFFIHAIFEDAGVFFILTVFDSAGFSLYSCSI